MYVCIYSYVNNALILNTNTYNACNACLYEQYEEYIYIYNIKIVYT